MALRVGVLLNRRILQKAVRGVRTFERIEYYVEAARELDVELVLFDTAGAQLNKGVVTGYVPGARGSCGTGRSSCPGPSTSGRFTEGPWAGGRWPACSAGFTFSTRRSPGTSTLSTSCSGASRAFVPTCRRRGRWSLRRTPGSSGRWTPAGRCSSSPAGDRWALGSSKSPRCRAAAAGCRAARGAGLSPWGKRGGASSAPASIITFRPGSRCARTRAAGWTCGWWCSGAATAAGTSPGWRPSGPPAAGFLTNVARGASVHVPEELFGRISGPREAARILEECAQLGLRAAETLAARHPRFADLGIDVGVDQEGKPFLIEVNRRDLRIMMGLSGQHSVHRLVYKNPIAYARHVLLEGA